MLRRLSAVVAVVVLAVALSGLGDENAPRVISWSIGTGVRSSYPHEATGQTTVFTTSSRAVHIQVEVDGPIEQSHIVRWKWYRPDNTLFYTSTLTTDRADPGRYWTGYSVTSSLNIAGTEAARYPGEWRVVVYWSGHILRFQPFTIRSSGSSGLNLPNRFPSLDDFTPFEPNPPLFDPIFPDLNNDFPPITDFPSTLNQPTFDPVFPNLNNDSPPISDFPSTLNQPTFDPVFPNLNNDFPPITNFPPPTISPPILEPTFPFPGTSSTGRTTNGRTTKDSIFVPFDDGGVYCDALLSRPGSDAVSLKVRFQVDTGAGISMLTRDLASDLGLRLKSGVPYTLTDVSGTKINAWAHWLDVTLLGSGNTRLPVLKIRVAFVDSEETPYLLGCEDVLDQVQLLFKQDGCTIQMID